MCNRFESTDKSVAAAILAHQRYNTDVAIRVVVVDGMTRRQLYASIAILGYLLQKTITDCNDHLALMEAHANIELDRLRLQQVEFDRQKIDAVLESAEAIWQEKEMAEERLKKVTLRRKEAKRWQGELP